MMLLQFAGLMLHILDELGQQVDHEETTQKEGMKIWINQSNGIQIYQAYRFVYDYNIAATDFVDLQKDEATDLLMVLIQKHCDTNATFALCVSHESHTDIASNLPSLSSINAPTSLASDAHDPLPPWRISKNQ